MPNSQSPTRFLNSVGVCASVALAACSTNAVASDTVLGAWRIEQARSEPMLDKRRARIDFGADGKLTGHTSCNTLSASYTLEGSTLKVGPVLTPRMACAQLQMEQEDRVLTALELAASARVRDDGLLELRDDEGRGLLRATRFEPAK